MEDLSKSVLLIGGIGTIWGKQFHQQNRIYSQKGVSVSITESQINGLYLRKWGNGEKTKADRKCNQ